MWPLSYLYIGAFSFIVSLVLVKFCLVLAVKFNFVDEPGPRKIQTRPIPMFGGVGIMLALTGTIFIHLIAVRVAVNHSSISDWFPSEILNYAEGIFKVSRKLLIILAGGTLVFLVGLVDDLYDLDPWSKLMAHICAASLLFFSGIRITLFIHNGVASYLFTVMWVVGITNAFNLLDNMDGLSSGIALIASLFLLVISIAQNEYFISLFLCAFSGSLLGFLVLNFHPAKIFMGDAGSYLIGYVMASITILGTYYYEKSHTLFSILMPVLIFGVPIYDLFSVVVIRLSEGRSVFRGDQKHFSHRLVDLGMNQTGAVLFLYMISFAFGTSSLLIGMVEAWGLYFILLQAVAFFSIIALFEYYGRKKSKTGGSGIGDLG